MDFQKIINDMNSEWRENVKWNWFSVNQLLEKLKVYNDDMIIEIWDKYPWYFHSYRWSYCELALTLSDKEKTLGEFRKECMEVDWKTYTWWKWWDYTMSWNDVIHIVEQEWTTSDWYLYDIYEWEAGHNISLLRKEKIDY